MNFLKYDSPIMVFLSKVLDLVFLNLVFVVSSLPIITIGAAYCGLYRGCLALSSGDGHALRHMLTAFRSNFKQATLIWLIQLSGAALLGVGYRMVVGGLLPSSMLALVVLIVGYLLLLILLVQAVFALPLTCRFNNSIAATLKNALSLGIRHFPLTAPLIVLNSIPALTLLAPTLFPSLLWLLGIGLYAGIVLVNVWCLERFVFSRYIHSDGISRDS